MRPTPAFELADVVRRHGEAYVRENALHLGRGERRVLAAVAACRTAVRERHHIGYQTVNAIATETGLSAHQVESALRRHGLEIVAHAATRHAAQQRAADVAGALGYATVAGYIRRRRADGWTWRAIAAESGQPQTWLRRQA